MRAVAIGALLSGVGVLTGCSAFGTSDAPSTDAGSSASTDAAADASTDAGVTGDGAPGDASTSPCQVAGHVFCADFDEGVLDKGWDALNLAGAGAAGALDTSIAVSPPASAHLSTPPTSCANAELRKLLPGGPYGYVKLAYDVRLGDTSGVAARQDYASAYIQLERSCALAIYPGSAAPAAIFQQNDANGQTGTYVNFTHGASPGTWSHVEVVLDAAHRTFFASIDGSSALAATSLPASCSTSAAVTIAVGPHCVSGLGVAEVRVDNVVVDAH